MPIMIRGYVDEETWLVLSELSFRPPVDPTTRSSVDHRLRTRPCKRLLRGGTLTTRSLARSSRFVSNSSDILALSIYHYLRFCLSLQCIVENCSLSVQYFSIVFLSDLYKASNFSCHMSIFAHVTQKYIF
jgi:hypothetical protein